VCGEKANSIYNPPKQVPAAAEIQVHVHAFPEHERVALGEAACRPVLGFDFSGSRGDAPDFISTHRAASEAGSEKRLATANAPCLNPESVLYASYPRTHVGMDAAGFGIPLLASWLGISLRAGYGKPSPR
jgi:hypothetical protein